MGTSVGQVCNRKPVTCAHDAEIRDVMNLMRDEQVGSVILTKKWSMERGRMVSLRTGI